MEKSVGFMQSKLIITLLISLAAITLSGCEKAVSVVPNCEPNKVCKLAGEVAISLSNEQPEPETPFTIVIEKPGLSMPKSAHLEGVNMYMGKIPVFFTQTSTGLEAEAMVGVCANNTMQWHLVLEWDEQTLIYPIETRSH